MYNKTDFAYTFVKDLVLDEHNTNSHLSIVLNIVYRQYVLCKILQQYRGPNKAVAGKAEICLGRTSRGVAGSTFLPKCCC